MTDVTTRVNAWNGAVHPAADIFPMIDDAELEQLTSNIKDKGLVEPGWLMPDGTLLDGRNRRAACERAGVPMRWRTYEGDDPIGFVLSLNLQRRHLTTGQKAALALEVEPLYAEQARARKVAAGEKSPHSARQVGADLPQAFIRGDEIAFGGQRLPWTQAVESKDKRAPRARDKAADSAGTSGRAVAQAKRVKEKAPDLFEQVKAGTLALDAAERQVKRRETQTAEADARTITVAEAPADAEGENWKLLLGDFRERLADIPAGSVDIIVTDPPYPAEFLPLISDLSRIAARVLKPQGVIVAMSGKIQLPEFMSRLGEHLQYGWMYVQPLPGSGTRIMARQVIQQWKPWLAYSNGPWPSGRTDWHPDMLDPSYRSKDRYRWEQDPDPAKMLIHELSDEGGLVLDPFTGTGAYGKAALAMGRKFIGVEMDAERFAGAADRLRHG